MLEYLIKSNILSSIPLPKIQSHFSRLSKNCCLSSSLSIGTEGFAPSPAMWKHGRSKHGSSMIHSVWGLYARTMFTPTMFSRVRQADPYLKGWDSLGQGGYLNFSTRDSWLCRFFLCELASSRARATNRHIHADSRVHTDTDKRPLKVQSLRVWIQLSRFRIRKLALDVGYGQITAYIIGLGNSMLLITKPLATSTWCEFGIASADHRPKRPWLAPCSSSSSPSAPSARVPWQPGGIKIG